MEYMNREQDLGMEDLRSAKESSYLYHMVNKYGMDRFRLKPCANRENMLIVRQE
jgi:hypothetical protein